MDNYQVGHRQRILGKLQNLEPGSKHLYSYELLEILLFFVNKRRDTRTLAKNLLIKFQSLHGVLFAPESALESIDGIGKQTSLLFRIIKDIIIRMQLENIVQERQFSSLSAVIEYCKTCMGDLPYEQVRMLCLNKRNFLLADVVISDGSNDSVNFDLRNTIQKALSFGSHAIILAHNHPSQSVYPSDNDLKMTMKLNEITKQLDIVLYDHIIVTRDSYFSMKETNIL